jgi:hypothetical protein
LALDPGDLGQSPAVVQTMQHLGYPTYFALLIGVWKVLGALVIVAPGLPRLKEWAYAGMFFDSSGAIVSQVAAGDGAGQWVPPLVFMAFALASWALRPASRTLLRGDGSTSSPKRCSTKLAIS